MVDYFDTEDKKEEDKRDFDTWEDKRDSDSGLKKCPEKWKEVA